MPGMDAAFWGPHAWEFLHSVTFDYPEEPTDKDKKEYAEFFHSIKNVLPCVWCRKHYKEGIEEIMPIEPHLVSRDELTRWLVDFHNSVNKRLNKPLMPYKAVYEKYESLRASRCKVEVIDNSPATCPPPSNAQCEVTVKNNTRKTNFLLFLILLVLFLAILFGLYGFKCMKTGKQELFKAMRLRRGSAMR